MKSRLTLATLVAAAALLAAPTSSQAGGLRLDKMGDCLFGWLRHDRHVAAAPATVSKPAPRPMK